MTHPHIRSDTNLVISTKIHFLLNTSQQEQHYSTIFEPNTPRGRKKYFLFDKIICYQFTTTSKAKSNLGSDTMECIFCQKQNCLVKSTIVYCVLFKPKIPGLLLRILKRCSLSYTPKMMKKYMEPSLIIIIVF